MRHVQSVTSRRPASPSVPAAPVAGNADHLTSAQESTVNSRAIALGCAAVIASTLLCVVAPMVIVAGMVPTLCGLTPVPSDSASVPTHQWDDEQVANAAT